MSSPRSTAELRQAFLEFFQSQEHSIIASSPLVPDNDPTLLFTNAGMVQFKDVFLGLDKRAYTRATTSQRCVRAGGKHNDLENVGYTARHHTFFEMLGNFSFGDYFKRDAIRFAWSFLTEVLKLEPEKLWITVFRDDDEAADIWLKEIGVSAERFSRCGEKDNFWSMGDTGPCGPCSEIFYDHGADIWGGPPGSPEEDGDRYIEIWNLVFMQFNRDADGTLTPLPKPSVDTGMGLERLAAVMQDVHNNYDIDLFQSILKAASALTGISDTTHASLRVIADHIRSCSFLIADGVVPSNEGRGYVLRRIIRRALRHGHKLGVRETFFYRLVAALDAEMGDAYPELRKSKDVIERVIKQEEERFDETLDNGMKVLEQAIGELDGKTTLPGELLFKLYDTYGFPVDLTADIARERELEVDMAGFESAMQAQRERARAASRFEGNWEETVDGNYDCDFSGYEYLEGESTITALFDEQGQSVDSLSAGSKGRVILANTPFYAESGGQVGDSGELQADGVLFTVGDTRKLGKAHVHLGELVQGSLKVGDHVRALVATDERQAIARNHSATHLLHAALRHVLGEHVKQKGSLVEAERLRFDFSHFEPISSEQLQTIERLVNEKIMNNSEVVTRLMSLEQAMESGAMALFGEKYAEDVRVLSMGEFSTELCGGTHVNQVGDIGLFKIIVETGVAAGVRRIEAITGQRALDWVVDTDQRLSRLAGLLKSDKERLEERVAQLLEQLKAGEKALEKLESKLASSQSDDVLSQVVEIKGVKLLSTQLEGVDPKRLRETLDQLKNKIGSGVIMLGVPVSEDKVSLIAGVTKDLTGKVKAGELVNHVAQQVGGKGGGRPDMAQAGGKDSAALPGALASVAAWLEEQLGA